MAGNLGANQLVVFGEIALDRRKVKCLEDRAGGFALQEKVETSKDQVLDLPDPGATGPALSVGSIHGHGVRATVAASLDRDQALPAAAPRLRSHSHHRHSTSDAGTAHRAPRTDPQHI